MELKEMGVFEINPEEQRAWMTHGCGYEADDDVRSKPGVEDDMYENGTWMLNDWVVNRKNNSFSNDVGRVKNNVHAVCTNKLGCACGNKNIEMGLPKELLDLFMHNLAKYEEEQIMYAKRYLQDHYTNMVREGEEINPDKGQEEETGC